MNGRPPGRPIVTVVRVTLLTQSPEERTSSSARAVNNGVWKARTDSKYEGESSDGKKPGVCTMYEQVQNEKLKKERD